MKMLFVIQKPTKIKAASKSANLPFTVRVASKQYCTQFLTSLRKNANLCETICLRTRPLKKNKYKFLSLSKNINHCGVPATANRALNQNWKLFPWRNPFRMNPTYYTNAVRTQVWAKKCIEQDLGRI